MGVLSWVIVGVIAGWVTCRLTRRLAAVDYALNIALGILGAAVGGFMTNLVVFRPPFELNLQSLIVAELAAIVFLMTFNAIRR